MKKIITSKFFKGMTLTIATLTSTALLAATTGVLQLQGVVPAVLSISVSAQPVATNLDLATNQTNLLVGSVTESSNSNTGYKISVSSLNDGNLKRSGGAQTFGYTFKYDGNSINLAGSSTTPAVAKTQLVAGSYSVSSNVTVSYIGVAASSMVAGTYQDTLTFEIAAN